MDYYKKTIWQPLNLIGDNNNFEILLDKDFVERMLKIEINHNLRNRMDQLGFEILKKYDHVEKSPYKFHQNTGLLKQINIDTLSGQLFSIENEFVVTNELNNSLLLKYVSHNLDSNPDFLATLTLFDNWIFYSDLLEDLSK